MRTPRREILPPYSACHKLWQCHNREYLLDDPVDRDAYLDRLFQYLPAAKAQGVRFHAFAIMGNHVHEVARIGEDVTPFSNWMREAHGAFGLAYNRRHLRLGKVSCERPKTIPLEDDAAILTVMFYTDANALAANLVGSARDWAWSSHAFYAYGEENRWTCQLDPPQAYLDLGNTPEERQAAYREGYAAYIASKGLVDLGPGTDAPSEGGDIGVDLARGTPHRPSDDAPPSKKTAPSWMDRLVRGDPDTMPAFGAPCYVEERRETLRKWRRWARKARRSRTETGPPKDPNDGGVPRRETAASAYFAKGFV